MKERPILFNDDHVRAILDGRKTQTRRVVKPQPSGGWSIGTAKNGVTLGKFTSGHHKKGKFGLFLHREVSPGSGKFEHDITPCPYGQPGDRLWVREAFAKDGWQIWYRADCDKGPANEVCQYQDGSDFEGVWRPSTQMPSWASRITLEITDVRVERLQDVSEADAYREGCTGSPFGESADLLLYPTFWDSINGPGSWDENPWVWVVEFERVR